VGPTGFQVTVQFNEPMNVSVNPTVTFPVENPAGTLTVASGMWLDVKTYRANYSVADLGVELADIDVSITGATDAIGNAQAPLTVTDLFDIDTKNPTVTNIQLMMARCNDLLSNPSLSRSAKSRHCRASRRPHLHSSGRAVR
jgi:hypothetical protein